MITIARQIGLVLLLLVLPVWAGAQGQSSEVYDEMSTEDRLYVRGLIRSVSVEKMEIAVRPLKGKRIIITLDPDTIMEGFEQIDELKKDQQVKVWYSIDNNINMAVRIKKMMELGC